MVHCMMKSMDLTVGKALYLYTICPIFPDSSDFIPCKESLFLRFCIEPPRHAWRRPAIQHYQLPKYLSLLLYLFMFALTNPPALAVAFPSSMPKRKSIDDFFKRARGRDSENNKDIVNGEGRGREVRKELQPGTKKNYHRSLALWRQSVRQSASGKKSFSDTPLLHTIDMKLNISTLLQTV